MATETKRQNFNITPEQEAELTWLREAIDAPTTKDTILRAVRVFATLAREAQHGRRLFLRDANGGFAELLIPELEPIEKETWNYLVARPHPWRRQLYVKGRRLRAFDVWMDMLTNKETPEQAAENWELPMEAIAEIVRYCESHRDLLVMEADEERQRLSAEKSDAVNSQHAPDNKSSPRLIEENGLRLFRFYHPSAPVEHQIRPGSARGQIVISDDFDEALEDFED